MNYNKCNQYSPVVGLYVTKRHTKKPVVIKQ